MVTQSVLYDFQAPGEKIQSHTALKMRKNLQKTRVTKMSIFHDLTIETWKFILRKFPKKKVTPKDNKELNIRNNKV